MAVQKTLNRTQITDTLIISLMKYKYMKTSLAMGICSIVTTHKSLAMGMN
jgi:hypothetical protein